MENKAEKVIEIDLLKVLKICLEKWWMFVIAIVVCFAAGYVGTKVFISPTYESAVRIYVNNQETSESDGVEYSDIQASTSLVDLYEVLLTSDDTLDIIMNEANVDYTYDELEEMIAAEAVNDTQIFEVSVTSTDASEAKRIAETIGNVLPDVINDTINGASAEIVSTAKLPEEQSGPNYVRNAGIGAIIGFLIVIVIIAIQAIRDTGIRSEDDIKEIVNAPILAHFPDLVDNVKRQNRYAQGYYRASGKERM